MQARDLYQYLSVLLCSRSYMISGANSGIGLVTAMFLAKKGKHTMHQPHSGIGIITLPQMEYNFYIGGMGNDVCGILL